MNSQGVDQTEEMSLQAHGMRRDTVDTEEEEGDFSESSATIWPESNPVFLEKRLLAQRWGIAALCTDFLYVKKSSRRQQHSNLTPNKKQPQEFEQTQEEGEDDENEEQSTTIVWPESNPVFFEKRLLARHFYRSALNPHDMLYRSAVDGRDDDSNDDDDDDNEGLSVSSEGTSNPSSSL